MLINDIPGEYADNIVDIVFIIPSDIIQDNTIYLGQYHVYFQVRDRLKISLLILGN